MSDKLIRHRETWKRKKIIRVIYGEWYRQILKDLKSTEKKHLELGAGSGNFKEFKPDVTASDIDFSPWLNICFDAHHIPFKKDSIGNIIMIDVLHHLADPVHFFRNASQVLEKGGRIVLLEPFPTVFSLFIYRRFHPEPFLMDRDYFSENVESSNLEKDPWEANQAAAYLIFFKYRDKFVSHFNKEFNIIKQKRISCILYPASGGFENPSMIPDFMIPAFKVLEFLLSPLRRWLAFRCYIVLEKR
jgi:SAM-dependent methyltransferase